MECKHCKKKFTALQTFLNHTVASHKFADTYPCCIMSCHRKLNSISALRKHVYICIHRYHCHGKQTDEPLLQQLIAKCDLANFESDPEFRGSDSTSNVLDGIVISNSTSVSEVMKFATKFYYNRTITRTVIQSVIEDTSELLVNILEDIKLKVLNNNPNLSNESKIEIDEIFSTNPFSQINTEHKRFKYLEQNNFLIKPLSYITGEMPNNKRKNNNAVLETKKSEGQFIQIRKVLKAVFELPNVYNQTMAFVREESHSNYISSLFQGELWKSIVSRYENKLVLPLLLYFDDFETGNPLGTHAGVHKLGAVYFSLPCIPSEYFSQLENIFLFGLFYSDDRVQFSNKAVFRPFIEELLYIESCGITINVNNECQTIYFVTPLVLGDNLGINAITGFTESFSSNYFCRFCIAHKKQTQVIVMEDKTLLRTSDTYDQHVRDKSYGVKEKCIWNELPYFKNTVNLCCDVMHDFFEGICRYDMAKILKYLVFEKRYFDISFLNNRIKYFNYCQDVDVGNAIPPINVKHIERGSIIMSAAEMHAFVAYFSVIIGDKVDEDDDVWNFYLLLLDIVVIVTRKYTSQNELLFLEQLISQHNSLYIELFQSHLLPKFHLILHYPNVIKNIGPLSKLSSFRFEAFHKVAKTNAHIVSSRVNIPYTLSIKHQLVLSYRLLLNKGFSNRVTIGGFICRYEDLRISVVSKHYIPAGTNAVKWVKKNGVIFKPQLYIKINQNISSDHQFGCIKYILYSSDEEIFFIYQKQGCYGFDQHFAGYQLSMDPVPLAPKYYLSNIKEHPVSFSSHLSGNGSSFISIVNLGLI